ncbi:fungal-specific transcription factor domain-containing protein [Dendryphion nanum]|uniref:Fungal-specific transcription factor domain-containing protein n=1 Tax=Dendryphion nanum TaxID=256645 RepID=A0A9P9D424_9PLEO|nr:fungal-specific transcription factor domain-containing protein [Dendryphion nanum]
METTKKTRACEPCHERKVRCDASRVGTPCTRCIAKDRTTVCVITEYPRQRNSGRRSQLIPQQSSRRMQSSSNIRLTGDAGTKDRSTARRSIAIDQSHVQQNVLDTPPSEIMSTRPLEEDSSTEADVDRTEDILYVSVEDSAPTNHRPRRIVVEYYKAFNPYTIVGEALNQTRRCGLVHTNDGMNEEMSSQEEELSMLDGVDREYAGQRRLHELPSGEVCDKLIGLFFQHVFVYLPIVECAKLQNDCQKRTCSTFLLYSIFVVALPFAPEDLLHDIGYTDLLAAQIEYFTRAKTLYDLGCERNDLSLLQGSILLASYQHFLDANKNSRYWFSNAVRLALQMGFHRSEIAIETDPLTYKLCRRIWWVLVQRDIFLVMAGVESTRRIIGDESDTSPVTLDNYGEDVPREGSGSAQLGLWRIKKLYLVESCKLALVGARVLRILQLRREPLKVDEVQELQAVITSWQSDLSDGLDVVAITSLNESNWCVVALQAIRLQMEMMLYRTLRLRHKELEPDLEIDISQQLVNIVLEGSCLFRKVMMHDAIRFTPPFLFDCVGQLVAVQIAMLQASDCVGTRAVTLQADLYMFLAYFEEMEKRWPSATKFSCLFKH